MVYSRNLFSTKSVNSFDGDLYLYLDWVLNIQFGESGEHYEPKVLTNKREKNIIINFL